MRSTKSKTLSCSQFVTDKKTLCSRLFNVVLVYIKKYWQKGIFFYPVFFYIFDSRLPSTAYELKFTLKHRPLSNLVFQESYLKKFKILFFPLESFVFIGMQLAIQCIKFNSQQVTFPCVWAPLEAFRYLPPSLVIFHFRFVILQGKNNETAVKYFKSAETCEHQK